MAQITPLEELERSQTENLNLGSPKTDTFKSEESMGREQDIIVETPVIVGLKMVAEVNTIEIPGAVGGDDQYMYVAQDYL